MKKKVMALLAVFVLLCAFLTGCTEVYKVSNNICLRMIRFLIRIRENINVSTQTARLHKAGRG